MAKPRKRKMDNHVDAINDEIPMGTQEEPQKEIIIETSDACDNPQVPVEAYIKLEVENIIDKIKNNLEVLKNIKQAAHATPIAMRIDALLESIKVKL